MARNTKKSQAITIRPTTPNDTDFILSFAPRFVAFELPKGRRKRGKLFENAGEVCPADVHHQPDFSFGGQARLEHERQVLDFRALPRVGPGRLVGDEPGRALQDLGHDPQIDVGGLRMRVRARDTALAAEAADGPAPSRLHQTLVHLWKSHSVLARVEGQKAKRRVRNGPSGPVHAAIMLIYWYK